jgi:type III secretory pathway component EscU
MALVISVMYLMLFIWSVMIIPFVIIGLLDIWFDFRRKIPAVGG